MKKLLSAILALVIAFSSSFMTFASNIDEIFKGIEERDRADAENEAQNNTDTNIFGNEYIGVPTYLTSTDYLYAVFSNMINLYVKDHLYEFTREEAIEKFLYDMIAQHPEMYEMMVNIMLGTMDSYSSYHEINSNYLSLESGNSGYGITVSETDDGIVIQNVSPQSEAEKAGILPGDILVGVFGYDVTGLSWNVVSLMLKRPYVYMSEKGENNKYPDYNPVISLTFNRNGELITFYLKKGAVVTQELSAKYMERDGRQIAYIGVSSFIDEQLAEKFKNQILKFKEDGYTKLVIDLRDNGGGSLQLAVEMAEIFVENGETMCYYNDKKMEEPTAVISDTEKISFDSISVLVNEHTASAAELMASILRDKAGAVLVGKTTFGKAIGQRVYSFISGSTISITTYEVLNANMESYNEKGLVPDLELDNVEMLYVLPELEIFNHENYKGIIYQVYSEPCLALEKRLAILGYLRESKADGIWDDSTTLAIYFLQRTYLGSGWTGWTNDKTVSLITDLINNCKDDTYLEDSQLDCALLYHASLDQARRLIKEKETLAKKQAKLIEENKKKLEAEFDN